MTQHDFVHVSVFETPLDNFDNLPVGLFSGGDNLRYEFVLFVHLLASDYIQSFVGEHKVSFLPLELAVEFGARLRELDVFLLGKESAHG